MATWETLRHVVHGGDRMHESALKSRSEKLAEDCGSSAPVTGLESMRSLGSWHAAQGRPRLEMGEARDPK